ncbi:hypothetical protein H5410_056498 [Solanum commersonii]|uniref:Uncharacterized protein n=1 Tax=Solanum commersonii TaxID=4109 RepID=A0A9J5WMF3_SOLCO|nr:hypothetical protein H5410_056498 [Solanum commersonii]
MTSKIWITKISMDYSSRKLAKREVYLLRGLFDLENGTVCLSGQTTSKAKVLMDVHITKTSMDYSTRKSVKREVYLLRGSFDLENGPFCLLGPTRSIPKVWTDVHE